MATHTQPKPAGLPTWFDLMTPDIARARDFYTAVFGWQYIVNGPEMGHYSLAQIRGHQAAGIGQIETGSNMPSAWAVYFATHDIQADSARLVQLGGQLISDPFPVTDQGWLAIGADPTGAVFGLWQSGQHIGTTITDEPGSVAWCEVNTRGAVRARDFYTALCGLTWTPMQGMEYYVLLRGDSNVCGVLQMDENWPESIPPHWQTYFAVSSTDEAVQQAVRSGGQVRVEPFDAVYGRIAVLADPFGATFAVVTMP